MTSMPIKLIFPDCEMEFKTEIDAQRAIRGKLGVARCTARRYVKDGVTNFKNFYRKRTNWKVYSVVFEGEVEARSGSCPQIMEWLEEMGHVISKNDRQRMYRRLKKLDGRTISISELVSAPASPAHAGRMGSAISAKNALTFEGVEGHSEPVTASQLLRDWNSKLSLGAIYKRLKAGLRTRRELLQPRWERNLQGRKKRTFMPATKPKSVKQVRPKISAEEIAYFRNAPKTKELPPMNTYVPPKPGYRRGE